VIQGGCVSGGKGAVARCLPIWQLGLAGWGRGYCNIIEAPWLVNGGHGASLRHYSGATHSNLTPPSPAEGGGPCSTCAAPSPPPPSSISAPPVAGTTTTGVVAVAVLNHKTGPRYRVRRNPCVYHTERRPGTDARAARHRADERRGQDRGHHRREAQSHLAPLSVSAGRECDPHFVSRPIVLLFSAHDLQLLPLPFSPAHTFSKMYVQVALCVAQLDWMQASQVSPYANEEAAKTNINEEQRVAAQLAE
jgi:hypothetical protein